jgi:hypothetical protein
MCSPVSVLFGTVLLNTARVSRQPVLSGTAWYEAKMRDKSALKWRSGEQSSWHSLTGNVHESAAHCSSCRARVRFVAVDDLVAPISRNVVGHERSQCSATPAAATVPFKRPEGILSPFRSVFAPPLRARSRQKRAARGRSACTGISDACDGRPPPSADRPSRSVTNTIHGHRPASERTFTTDNSGQRRTGGHRW